MNIFEIRNMRPGDYPAVVAIFSEGIEDGVATFDTRVFSSEEFDLQYSAAARLVLLSPERQCIGWAAVKPVSSRACFTGVGEISIYLQRQFRGKGLGALLLKKLILISEDAGFWTLQAGIFPENLASLKLHEKLGFRVVGKREKIAQHHGQWKDIFLLERRSPKF